MCYAGTFTFYVNSTTILSSRVIGEIGFVNSKVISIYVNSTTIISSITDEITVIRYISRFTTPIDGTTVTINVPSTIRCLIRISYSGITDEITVIIYISRWTIPIDGTTFSSIVSDEITVIRYITLITVPENSTTFFSSGVIGEITFHYSSTHTLAWIRLFLIKEPPVDSTTL